MADLIRSKDWSETSLGPIHEWPVCLQTTVSLCLGSGFPINIIWGPDHIQIYNDGFKNLIGSSHPQAMGESYKVTWKSYWPLIGKSFEDALSGKTSCLKNQRIFLDRSDFPEETFFTFSLSPIRNENGSVVGIFNPVTETTGQMLSERRLGVVRQISSGSGKAETLEEAATLVAFALKNSENDIPFHFIYLLSEEQTSATLFGQNGASEKTARFTRRLDLSEHKEIAEVLKSKLPATLDGKDLSICFPIINSATTHVIGLFILGINQSVPFDLSYETFNDLLIHSISTTFNNALLFQEERTKIENLEILDRAKTKFFSNISHEFRTPLTLILGSINESLSDTQHPLNTFQRAYQELAQRNGLRLLKLVNTLLDFSRIEAGRVEGKFQPTDLAALTKDLASSFRSVIEHANVSYKVHAEELGELIYVDHIMWEKIVLNLLSNAYKFTFKGEITLTLTLEEKFAVLSISDSGIGIPKQDLPYIFERFHQVDHSRARTQEGTGIGLSLVYELTKIHGGRVDVKSSIGEGSIFRVHIPRGIKHLKVNTVRFDVPSVSTEISSEAYVKEALRWTSDSSETISHEPNPNIDQPLILMVDDNQDMREYVARILKADYRVVTVNDGAEALSFTEQNIPDLILSDIMMPNMDGYELLNALRADLRTKLIPIIFLTARAGEESRIEGLNHGVNDYLEKPFIAGELLARIRSNIEINRLRQDVKLKMDNFFMQAPIPMVIFEGPKHDFTLANPPYEEFIGRQATGRKLFEVFDRQEIELFLPLLDEVYRTGVPYIGKNLPFHERWIDVSYHPMRGVLGRIKGILAIVIDVTDQYQSSQNIENQNQELLEERIQRERFVDALSHDLRSPLTSAKLGAELLARKIEDPKQLTKIDHMISSLNRVDTMIKNLLDANQIKAGEKPAMHFDLCHLNVVISSTLKDLATVYGARFIFESKEDVYLQCDISATRRILENLLNNAVKYGFTETQITILLTTVSSEARIEIHNFGPVIRKEDQESIFEPFQRTEDALSGTQKGWGIGLSLVRTLVEAQGGTVSVQSSAQDGTTFSFTIPLIQNTKRE